jgi:small subunit ribosomal protein S3
LGQKVNPIGLRLGIIRNWDARWFSEKEYTKLLHEDLDIRKMIANGLADAAIARVEIDRSANNVIVTVHTARPGIIIGRNGARIEELRKNLETLSGKRVRVNIQEIRHPEANAYLIARSIAEQIQRRVAYKRAMKQAVLRAFQPQHGVGVKGIKITLAGRLGGAEMSRRERKVAGKVPLHTLRADIDYGHIDAHTTFGAIGIKVWVYNGEILPVRRVAEVSAPAPVETVVGEG